MTTEDEDNEMRIVVHCDHYRYEVSQGDDDAFIDLAYGEEGEKSREPLAISIDDVPRVIAALQKVWENVVGTENAKAWADQRQVAELKAWAVLGIIQWTPARSDMISGWMLALSSMDRVKVADDPVKMAQGIAQSLFAED